MNALKRIALMGMVLILAILSTAQLASADSGEGGTSFELVLNSWPVILAAGCGFLATHLTDFLTHRNAPQLVKSAVNFGLTALAGVLIAVEVVPGKTWKDYVGLILAAWIVSMVTHATGVTNWVQTKTGSAGLGKPAGAG